MRLRPRHLASASLALAGVALLGGVSARAQEGTADDFVRRLAPRPSLTRSLVAAPTRRIEVVPGQQDKVLAATEGQPSVKVRVLFDYGSDGLTQEGEAALKPLGQALQDPRLQSSRLLIAGHTDARGSDDFNQSLSERRARAVREHLILAFHVAPERLEAMGFGRRKLADPAHPEEPANRRVEIINLGP